MLKNLISLLLFAAPFTLLAQYGDREAAIISVVQEMFDGMRKGDSAMVRSVFEPSARLQTTFTDRQGKPALKSEDIAGFVAAVGTPHDEVWDERIWGFDLNVDGNLATVWTDYTFFLGEKMSHCGVNAFQLFFNGAAWKITQINDTRRKDNCQTELADEATAVNVLMDAWHHAAAVADEDSFFGSMAADGIYLGTDATERWLRDEMKDWSAKYFEKDSAWAFVPHDRHIYFSRNGNLAWFDELLDTWMGTCRGSGVLQKQTDGWKIKQYNLAVTVPNDAINGFIELVKKTPTKND